MRKYRVFQKKCTQFQTIIKSIEILNCHVFFFWPITFTIVSQARQEKPALRDKPTVMPRPSTVIGRPAPQQAAERPPIGPRPSSAPGKSIVEQDSKPISDEDSSNAPPKARYSTDLWRFWEIFLVLTYEEIIN